MLAKPMPSEDHSGATAAPPVLQLLGRGLVPDVPAVEEEDREDASTGAVPGVS